MKLLQRLEGFRSAPGGLRGSAKWILLAIAALVLGVLVLWLVDRLFLLSISRSYIDQIAAAFNLNRHLAEAISLAVCILLVASASLLASFSRRRRMAGLLGMVALLIANSLVLWQGTKDKFFEASGTATKCYVMTREGVRFGERPGVDLATGRQCKPVTPDLMERLQQYAQGKRPERIVGDDPIFFDLKTGEPTVWYARMKTGQIEIFDLMGYHPETGEELQAVTREIVEEWRRQQAQLAARPPQRITDPEKFVFFDPKNGTPRAWFWRTPDSTLEFYDNKGYQPRTGEPLQVVTRDIVAEWGAQSAKKCYIVTRETVRFGSTPGLDPQSGRECRPFNAALLERLREYEKGNRPKLVTASDPTFFDLRTGEPNLWYSKSDSNGRIKLFDLIGFDPETGQELLPVTPQIAAAWKKQIDAVARRPPQKVDPEKYAFFDTVTGEPRVWYWRGGYAEWEFYDNAGFRSTGEKLTLISQPLIDQWRRENAEKRRQAAEQAAKTEKERLAAQEAERKRREEEDARQLALQQSGENCDRAAANPTDSKRPASVAGVEYNDLKSHAKEAAEACDRAAKMHPAEARYRYNRARALEFINPQQAINLHVSLTKEGYAAAHDNLGGLFWKERKDLQGAIKEYEAGVKLGDPSAMVSLAWLIKNNLYSIADPVSARFALLTKAAQAGHKTAQDMLSKEQQELQLRAYQQQNQQMQQQMMFNMFNTVLRNMAH